MPDDKDLELETFYTCPYCEKPILRGKDIIAGKIVGPRKPNYCGYCGKKIARAVDRAVTKTEEYQKALNKFFGF